MNECTLTKSVGRLNTHYRSYIPFDTFKQWHSEDGLVGVSAYKF